MGQGLDESILQDGGVPLSDMAGSVTLSAILVHRKQPWVASSVKSLTLSVTPSKNSLCQ